MHETIAQKYFMETTNDISIGKNKWISWINFDLASNDEIFEIDNLLKPTFAFWEMLETQCMAECCGIEAFAFWEDDIRLAINKVDKNELTQNLLHAKIEIENRVEGIVSSAKLNNLMDKSVFIQLLNHIIETLSEGEDR